jgi:hypothetical protein
VERLKSLHRRALLSLRATMGVNLEALHRREAVVADGVNCCCHQKLTGSISEAECCKQAACSLPALHFPIASLLDFCHNWNTVGGNVPFFNIQRPSCVGS